MKGVYKFFWDCGRHGNLQGVFVADDKAVKAAIGKTACFGEVLGKHSDINGTLYQEDLTLVTTDPAFVKLFEKFKLSSGFNPLEVIDES